MIAGFSVYDAHTHLGIARHSGRRCSADDLLRAMDRFGVDRSLAIPFPVVDDYRAAHDLIGAAVRAHPDRLAGAACLYPFLPEAEFRSEVRRCREQYGFRALKLQPQYQPLNPVSRASDFFFECARENGMAVICHTGAGAPFALPSLFMMPARRFPELQFVLAHAGGGAWYHEAIVAAAFCPNIALEVSTLTPQQVIEVLREAPGGRVMIGSDLPENLEMEMGKILTLDIAQQAKREILFATACSIFGS